MHVDFKAIARLSKDDKLWLEFRALREECKITEGMPEDQIRDRLNGRKVYLKRSQGHHPPSIPEFLLRIQHIFPKWILTDTSTTVPFTFSFRLRDDKGANLAVSNASCSAIPVTDAPASV